MTNLFQGASTAHRAAMGATVAKKTTGKGLLDITDKVELSKLLDILDIFRTIRATMPLQYVVTLLLVATDEGQSVQEYARRLGVSPSVMSRHLLDIGERNRHMEQGFGLVTYRPNPMNLREHEYFLTDKGRQIAQAVVRKMKSGG